MRGPIARSRRTSSLLTRTLAIAAGACVTAVGGWAVWRARPQPPPTAPPSALSLAVAPLPVASVQSTVISPSVAFTETALTAVARDWQRRSVSTGSPEEGALVAAVDGIRLLPSERAREVGQALQVLYDSLQVDDRTSLERMLRAIQGGTAEPREITDALRLMTAAAERLPDVQRARLQRSLEAAVLAAVDIRAAAADQNRAAAVYEQESRQTSAPAIGVQPPALTPRANNSGRTGTGSSEQSRDFVRQRGEEYWRQRAIAGRAAVVAAEQRVSELERQTKNAVITLGPRGPTCVEGLSIGQRGPVSGRGSIELRDASRGVVTCRDPDSTTRERLAELEQARRALTNARRTLSALEEEARQAGALPGWLR